jgi:cation transport ATPase
LPERVTVRRAGRDEVFAGTLSGVGALEVRAEKVGEETTPLHRFVLTRIGRQR